MEDPSLYSQMKAHIQQPQPQFQEEEHLKCPRCDSRNTKFCYYNNYNLSQPRHFCKSCKRYWTKGGTLRNIPVGGGSRKNTKRRSASSSSAIAKDFAAAASISSASNLKKNDCQSNNGEMTETLLPRKEENYGGQFGNFLEVSGRFSSIFGPREGQYSNLNGVIIGPNGSIFQKSEDFCDTGMVENGLETGSSNNNADGFFNIQGDGGGATGWSGGTNNWPDLAIYTPSSSFP